LELWGEKKWQKLEEIACRIGGSFEELKVETGEHYSVVGEGVKELRGLHSGGEKNCLASYNGAARRPTLPGSFAEAQRTQPNQKGEGD